MIYIGMRGDFEVRFPGKSRFSRLKRGKFREREGGGGAQMGRSPPKGKGMWGSVRFRVCVVAGFSSISF